MSADLEMLCPGSTEACYVCNGAGQFFNSTGIGLECATCRGTGRVLTKRGQQFAEWIRVGFEAWLKE